MRSFILVNGHTRRSEIRIVIGKYAFVFFKGRLHAGDPLSGSGEAWHWRRNPNLLIDVNGEAKEFAVLTVLGSVGALATDHTASIVLETEDFGTLAIPMTIHSCAMLRKAISDVEQFLHQPPGHA